MEKGKIIQVSGPVIDVLFEKGNLPHIKDALTVDNHGKNVSWKLQSIWDTMWSVALCWPPVKGSAATWKSVQTGAGHYGSGR